MDAIKANFKSLNPISKHPEISMAYHRWYWSKLQYNMLRQDFEKGLLNDHKYFTRKELAKLGKECAYWKMIYKAHQRSLKYGSLSHTFFRAFYLNKILKGTHFSVSSRDFFTLYRVDLITFRDKTPVIILTKVKCNYEDVKGDHYLEVGEETISDFNLEMTSIKDLFPKAKELTKEGFNREYNKAFEALNPIKQHG